MIFVEGCLLILKIFPRLDNFFHKFLKFYSHLILSSSCNLANFSILGFSVVESPARYPKTIEDELLDKCPFKFSPVIVRAYSSSMSENIFTFHYYQEKTTSLVVYDKEIVICDRQE